MLAAGIHAPSAGVVAHLFDFVAIPPDVRIVDTAFSHPPILNKRPVSAVLLGSGYSRRTYPWSRVCNRESANARQTRHHSPAAAGSPRSENWRKPNISLMMPITGSTVHLRNP